MRENINCRVKFFRFKNILVQDISDLMSYLSSMASLINLDSFSF